MGIYLDNVFCRKCKVKLDFTENVEAYEDKRFLCHICKDKLGIPYQESEVKMRIKKRIVIVADILCDEDFDCNELLIAQDVGNDVIIDTPPIYVGCGEDGEWEIVDYVFQADTTLSS